MPWPKGVARAPEHRANLTNKGRPKGIPNKLSKDIKEMVLQALVEEGGVTYLREQARENPTAFMGLIGRVIPLQVTGEGGGPIVIHWQSPGDAAKAAALPLVIEHAVTDADDGVGDG